MEVPDGLAPVSVAVHDNTEPGFRETQTESYRAGRRESGGGDFRGCLTDVENRGDVHAGNDEVVVRRLGSNITDSDNQVVLVYDPGGCGPVDYAAENAGFTHPDARITPPADSKAGGPAEVPVFGRRRLM